MTLSARARAVAEQVDGRTVLTTLRSQVPLSLRETADGLTVLASAFGPLGGDRTHLEVAVGPGARLSVGSAAAQVAQPGALDPVSHATVSLDVAAGATLRWQPQPLVVTAGAVHRVDLSVRAETTSTVVLVDTVVLGRSGATAGRCCSTWRVEVGGVPLLSADLDVGPGAPEGWDGPAVLGGARVVVTALVARPGLPPDLARSTAPVVPGGEVLPLAGPGVLLTWVGSSTVAAARAVTAFLADLDVTARPSGEPDRSLDGGARR